MNPYDILGVARDADAATIKAAYRRESSKAHPDREGGSAERMAEINQANDILSDPDKRAHYDSTGQMNKPDLEGQAMQVAVAAFMQFIELADPVAAAVEHIQAEMKKADKHANEVGFKIARLEAKVDKIKVKDGKPNVLANAINNEIESLHKQCATVDAFLDRGELALKFLRDYEMDDVRVEFTGSKADRFFFNYGGY